jgi:hypothetical protein
MGERLGVRSMILLVLVASACARMPALRTASTSTSAAPATCALQALPNPLAFESEDTRQAVQAFEHYAGSPYAALYISRAAGRPSGDVCVRVVQQSADSFMRYTYHHGQVDSSRIRRSAWQSLLARQDAGNYMAQCTSFATDPVFHLLLVKLNATVVISLCLEEWQYWDLSAADKARIAPAREFMQLLTN